MDGGISMGYRGIVYRIRRGDTRVFARLEAHQIRFNLRAIVDASVRLLTLSLP
jgi:hypothetical protein